MIIKSATDRDGERKLAQIFRSLSEGDRNTLVRFAEFLAASGSSPAMGRQEALDPKELPRPRQESVVSAIKRLSRSYYMLDRSRMLDETSGLMAAHVLNGRSAKEVIDELEVMFARHYAAYREQR